MVMFKARFRPMAANTLLQAQQHQRQPPQARVVRGQQQQQPQPAPKVPPIEEERGPQAPVREPEPRHEPERALEV